MLLFFLTKSYNLLLTFFPDYFNHWTLLIIFLSEYYHAHSFFCNFLKKLNEIFLQQLYLHSSSIIKKVPVIINELTTYFGKKIIDLLFHFLTKLIEFIVLTFYITAEKIFYSFINFYLKYKLIILIFMRHFAFRLLKLLSSFVFDLYLYFHVNVFFIFQKLKDKVIFDIYNNSFTDHADHVDLIENQKV